MAPVHRGLLSRVAWLLCAAALGCSGQVHVPPPVCSAPQGSAADAQQLATADTDFALAFYPSAVTAAGAGQNLIVSPYSVSATLTMVDTGAAGETDAQIQSVLHLPGNGATIAPAYAALACADETDGTGNGNQLSLANTVWTQQGATFEPAFLSVLSTGYDAPLQQVDFAGDTAGAESDINAWVSQQTQGQIPALLQGGDISAKTRLVLVDAVYFKGKWAAAFDASRTAPQPFTLPDGTQASVPTMSGTVNLGTGQATGLSVYELPYQGGALAMDFLLPTKGGSLASLETSLTGDSLTAALSSIAPAQQVELLLPKFSFQTRLELAPLLAAMGMPDLFDPTKANLSGMDGAEDLSVDDVVQVATVEVDESGTVATAATSADTCSCEGEEVPPTVAIDEPFVFLIRDTRSGSILFIGHVVDPRQG
jgi:serpin B